MHENDKEKHFDCLADSCKCSSINWMDARLRSSHEFFLYLFKHALCNIFQAVGPGVLQVPIQTKSLNKIKFIAHCMECCDPPLIANKASISQVRHVAVNFQREMVMLLLDLNHLIYITAIKQLSKD